MGNAFAVENVEDCLLKGRRHLVLHHLHARFVTDHFVVLLQRAATTDIETHGAVELERVTARGRFRIAVAADLHANLIDEDHHRLRARDARCELAQRLGHQASLKSRKGIAHFTLDFISRRKRSHRIDDDQIYGTRPHERIHDFKSLLTRIRLTEQEFLQVDSESGSVLHVKRVLCIDEGTRAAGLLHLRNNRQRKRRFAGGFRPENFDDSSARKPTDAERQVETQRTRGHCFDILNASRVIHAHDGALTKLFFNVGERRLQRLFTLLSLKAFNRSSSFVTFGGHFFFSKSGGQDHFLNNNP